MQSKLLASMPARPLAKVRLATIRIEGGSLIDLVPDQECKGKHRSEPIAAGFKSYAQPVMLDGLQQFTCIVGANGAGKSVVVSSATAECISRATSIMPCGCMRSVKTKASFEMHSHC